MKIDTKLFQKKAVGIIHKVYCTQLKIKRKYLASTKTKAEIQGGGKKPWKQKGTGNARAGSIRSPLRVGGGVIFGPKPRIVKKKINKKEKRLAILSAFYLKKSKFHFLEDSVFDNLENYKKTKEFTKFLLDIYGEKAKNEKILLILLKDFSTIKRITRNIKNIEISLANCLNVTQLLNSKHILLSKKTFELVNSLYGKI